MSHTSDAERSRLDDAARAGWLYFIAGNTQDEIARKLNISRPTAQRLVSLALSEKLITFRLDHPIAACMELAARLTERYGLQHCQIVPADPTSESSSVGIAEAAASLLEQKLRGTEPIVVGLGTGRSLRAAVEQVPRLNCQHHRLVSLVGHISMEGSASFFDVLARLSDLVQAPHYPMPLPVVMPSRAERDQLIALHPVQRLRELAADADMTLVGIGRLDENAPLYIDGFISTGELAELQRLGAVGEVTGWAFDAAGRIIDGGTNHRLTSVPRPVPATGLVVAVAMGLSKALAIRAALRGGIVNGLITNETTAKTLLDLG
ncbi:sugar-binding transcriptional regulator [Kaistia dalseonensis]|uniref:DNA-binding transcriptional regulator LsrR (DeoR family) n=1 Tax=Kaistia dalseonensis TaxID=410840 RepID=A0ABU0HBU7_9HYPH|nr:sugar-binding transcriptional regulator [Kaistia dalseonensis]MCX5496722.1 sugar-binding transcriptional regulator [Kaistia dalseonensis]MDQ0439348.1 DNA-binding transcriptional regulator LsrR (DeoR family) [Kaistia dalseonensis]